MNLGKKLLAFVVLFGVFFLACPKGVLAATYYVDATNGLDTNSGTATDEAWQTINKVNTSIDAATITAGDTVYFKKGETFTGFLDVDTGGTVGNILTFDAYGTGENPVIDATGNLRGIDIRGMSYVSFKNLTIINATDTGILFYTGLDNIVVENLNVSSTPKAITLGPGTFSNIAITTSVFSGNTNGLSGAAGTTYTNWTIDGATFNGSSGNGAFLNNSATNTNITIQNSQFSNNGGMGLYINKTNGLTISNTQLNSNSLAGLVLYDVVNVDMDSITASNNGDTGLYLYGTTLSETITLDDSTFENNGQAIATANGLSLAGTGDSFVATNVISNNNANDGFSIHDAWTSVIFDSCTADENGVTGAGADGDGFTFHETSSGTIRYSISSNNKKTAVANVGTSDVNMHHNLFYHDTNGTQPLILLFETGNYTLTSNTIYSGGQTGTGLRINDGSLILKNNIIFGFDVGVLVAGGSVANNYNIVYGAGTANWSGITQGTNSISLDPKFNNASSNDFTLQSTSPAIDSGTDVGLTTDFDGNPIYGTPDIGAYEYQPPYTIGTDNIDIDGNARVYADGKFRSTSANSGSTASLSVTPVGGFGSGDYSEWMDIDISNWNNSGTYKKTWTESSSSIGSASTVHTVGDLRANQRYMVKVNDVLGANITGDNCFGNYCISDSSGEIVFTYSGGYSTVTFEVEEDSTNPASFSIVSPSGYTKDNTRPSLTFNKSSDDGSGLNSYVVSLDPGKNRNFSTSGIPTSGNGTANYIWKDDSDVKVEFLHEEDSDPNNDEIRVYFKDLDDKELREGKHTWIVTAYDQVSNSTSQSADFYLDQSKPNILELAIADFSLVNDKVSYNLNAANRTPSFSGLITDIYQGSEVTNSDESKDTFDKVSSGPKTITLTISKLKSGYSSTDEDAEYEQYLTKDFDISDISNIDNDKKIARFFITTPFPLIDGYYQVLLTAKDKAGNEYSYSVFYLSLNNKVGGWSNPISTTGNLFNDKLDTKVTSQETTPTNTEEESKQVEENGYSVKVRVVDPENNPIPNAKVTMHSKVQETTSDENGYAYFENVEKGDHKVLIAYDDYEGEQKINLTGEVRQFDLTIQVKEAGPFSSWIERGVLGLLIIVIAGLGIFVYKAKKKNSNKNSG